MRMIEIQRMNDEEDWECFMDRTIAMRNLFSFFVGHRIERDLSWTAMRGKILRLVAREVGKVEETSREMIYRDFKLTRNSPGK